MMILAPFPSVPEACIKMPWVCRSITAQGVLWLASCHHEETEYASLYRDHPTYQLWSDHLVFGIEYATQLIETAPDIPGSADLLEQLSREMELATSGEFDMRPHSLWNSFTYHWQQQCLIATMFPGTMLEELRAHELDWVRLSPTGT